MLAWLAQGEGPSRFQGMAALALLELPGVLELPAALQVRPALEARPRCAGAAQPVPGLP